jgi:L-ascorbate oxidase
VYEELQMNKICCVSLLTFAFFVANPVAGYADPFKVLDSFQTNPKTGVLDLELKIEPYTNTFTFIDEGGIKQYYNVRSNLYDACLRNGLEGGDPGQRNHCSKNYFGGPRLVLKQGDKLKVHLKNLAEPIREYGSKEPEDSAILPKPGEGFRVADCTNIHTHGLIVRANAPDDRRPDEPADSYGDNVFVMSAPANAPPGTVGCEANGTGPHAKMAMGEVLPEIKYEINIPGEANVSSLDEGAHPSGLFWFHPHVHSLAKEQVSGGLSGMINVGSIRDYGCLDPADDGTCRDGKNGSKTVFPPLRHMLLKDIQIGDLNEPKHTAAVVYDQDAGFCEGQTGIGLNGFCNHFNGNSQLTGRWLFTINGAVHPQWSIPSGRAEVWRVQNASANVTYDLRLGGGGWVADNGNPLTDPGGMPFQVLSLDGVGLGLVTTTGEQGFKRPLAFQRRLILMPGSRAEILVTLRDPKNCDLSEGKADWANCPSYAPSKDTEISIVNVAYATGGDTWPKIELASINYKGSKKSPRPISGIALQNNLAENDAPRAARALSARAIKNPVVEDLCKSGSVKRLVGGEKRRVYFAIISDEDKPNKETDPNWRAETFVLGSSIIGPDGQDYDEDGVLLPDGPLLQPAEMSDLKSDLCVPFGDEETWELVNLSEEVHNFHLHQNKFKVLREDPQGRQLMVIQDPLDAVNIPDALITKAGEEGVTHDTIIVPRGAAAPSETVAGDCNIDLVTAANPNGHFVKENPAVMAYRVRHGSVCRGNYRDGDKAGAIGLGIPFTRTETIGRYVYHCHILEHEDLGMMSSIRVLSQRQLAGVNEQ